MRGARRHPLTRSPAHPLTWSVQKGRPRMTHRIILDVDTGTDDAVALMVAALSPEIELLGATTVNGNTLVHNCTENTLRVFDYIGKSDIPVYEGMSLPLSRPNFVRDEPSKIHGDLLDVPPARSKQQDKPTADRPTKP